MKNKTQLTQICLFDKIVKKIVYMPIKIYESYKGLNSFNNHYDLLTVLGDLKDGK